MYRPHKRKLVRRLSAVSAVTLATVAGLGATFISHSGATTSTPRADKAATTSEPTGAPSSSANYHLVNSPGSDDAVTGDN